MSKIRALTLSGNYQVSRGAFDSVENSLLVTTGKMFIFNDQIALPTQAYGDVLYNISLIFNNMNDTVITAEVSCSVDSDGLSVIFDSDDNLNGKYAVVSYLGKINE